MDDQMRVSDADRDRVAARLRDHFAEGRLTSDELDERLSATLSAKTFGDLRRIMADLPGPSPVSPQPAQQPQQAAAPWITHRRGPRFVPVLLLVLLMAVLLPGSHWVFFAFLKPLLLVALVVGAARILVTLRSRRRMQQGRRDRYARYGRRGTRW